MVPSLVATEHFLATAEKEVNNAEEALREYCSSAQASTKDTSSPRAEVSTPEPFEVDQQLLETFAESLNTHLPESVEDVRHCSCCVRKLLQCLEDRRTSDSPSSAEDDSYPVAEATKAWVQLVEASRAELPELID